MNTSSLSLWKFTADGSGGGEWATDSPSNPALLTDLDVGVPGIMVTCGNTAYMLGGYVSGMTDSRLTSGPVPIPGLMTYNISSKTVGNQSIEAFVTDSIEWGGGACLSTFGSDGLIAFLGGQATGAAGFSETAGGYLSFSNITLYDPAMKAWYYQTTTGEAPAQRFKQCTVGVQGPNGTYEM